MTKGITCFCLILFFAWSVLHAQVVDESVLASGPEFNDANETTIGVNPLDSNNVIAGANDGRANNRCGAYASFDGGRSWTQQLLGSPADNGEDPALTFDNYGNAYYACLHRATRVDVHRSKDGGRTWQVMGTVVPLLADKPYITFDPTREGVDVDGNPVNVLYVAWTQRMDSRRDIFFSQSIDGGTTWSPRFQISESPGINIAAVPAVDNDGNVVVAWQNTNQSQLLMAVVDPETQTTGGEILVGGQNIRQANGLLRYRTNSNPAIAFDRTMGPNTGTLYVVWANQRDGDVTSIWETATRDLGKTWQQPIDLNPNPPVGNNVQIFPWISVTSEGQAFASYYDSTGATEPDPSDRKLRYWGSLFSGFIMEAPPKMLLVNPSDLWTDPTVGFTFIGDYTGNACTSEGGLMCYFAWMANATSSTQDIYVGRIHR